MSAAKERPTNRCRIPIHKKPPYTDQRAAHTIEVLDVRLSHHTRCVVSRTAHTIEVLTV